MSLFKLNLRGEGLGFFTLFLSSILNTFFGVVIGYYLTRLLGVEGFGSFSYINGMVSMGCILLSFGFFYSGSRILLLEKERFDARNFFGVTLYAICFIAVFVALFCYIFLCFTTVDKSALGFQLFFVCLFGSFSFLLIQFFETIVPAGGMLDLVAKSRIYPKVFFISVVVISFYAYKISDVPALLFLNYSITLLVLVVLFFRLNPLFSGRSEIFKKYFSMNKDYGFNLYLGSIFTVGGTASTGVLIGLLGGDLSAVGYYSLATSLCSPLLLVSASTTGAYLRKFSVLNIIPPALIFALVAVMLIPSALLYFLVDYLVSILWGDGFLSVSEYTRVLIIASVLYGVGDLFKQFLVAKGEGKMLRDGSFLVGFILISLTIAFVANFGGIGAAIARVGAGGVYLALMVFYYKKTKCRI